MKFPHDLLETGQPLEELAKRVVLENPPFQQYPGEQAELLELLDTSRNIQAELCGEDWEYLPPMDPPAEVLTSMHALRVRVLYLVDSTNRLYQLWCALMAAGEDRNGKIPREILQAGIDALKLMQQATDEVMG